MAKFWTRFRSAVTGRFIKKEQADKTPRTTYGEKVEVKDEEGKTNE